MFIWKFTHRHWTSYLWYLCRDCSSTYSTDNELAHHQKLCLEHEPVIMKFPEELSFRFTKYYQKITLNFLGVADFEKMNKGDITMNGKLTKNIYEQVLLNVSLHDK